MTVEVDDDVGVVEMDEDFDLTMKMMLRKGSL